MSVRRGWRQIGPAAVARIVRRIRLGARGVGTPPAGAPPAGTSPAGTSHAGVVRVVAVRVVLALDWVDETVLPPTARTLNRVSYRLGDAAGEGYYQLRDRASSVVGPRTDADGTPVAPTGLRAALRPDGLVARAARVGVIATVGLIVVSAATASLQSPTTAQLSTDPPPAGLAPGGNPAPGSPGASGGSVPPSPTVRVGPYPGDPVETYLVAAGDNLANLAAAAPDAELHAVVSLGDYLTPDELRALFADYRLVRVFLRTPPDGAVVSGAVRDPSVDLDAVFATAARQASGLVDTTAADEVRQRASRDAAAFEGRCACLFAAVVRAPAARLAELAELAAVRVVDAAPPGSSPATTAFVPLVPERD